MHSSFPIASAHIICIHKEGKTSETSATKQTASKLLKTNLYSYLHLMLQLASPFVKGLSRWTTDAAQIKTDKQISQIASTRISCDTKENWRNLTLKPYRGFPGSSLYKSTIAWINSETAHSITTCSAKFKVHLKRDSTGEYLDVAVGRRERQRRDGGHLGGDLPAPSP
jgi:hypothetical protein